MLANMRSLVGGRLFKIDHLDGPAQISPQQNGRLQKGPPLDARRCPKASRWTTFHALQRQHHLQRHRDVDRVAAVRNLIKAV